MLDISRPLGIVSHVVQGPGTEEEVRGRFRTLEESLAVFMEEVTGA